MRVAVTGAGGFIGSHVVAELGHQPVETVAVVRAVSGVAGGDSPGHVVEMDIEQPGADPFDRMGRPDVLIHLAWGGLPNYRSPHHYDTELPAHLGFLKALIDAGLPSLFVAGTCLEYGMQSGVLREDMVAAPENSYGRAKDALRRELEHLKAGTPFSLTWGRLFYMYGEGQAETSLYPQLRRAVERGDPAFDMSGGDQLRDYLPVSEVARIIVALSICCRDQGIVNICSGNPVSIRSLAEGWVRDHQWGIVLNFGRESYANHEPMAFWGDRSRLDSMLEGRSAPAPERRAAGRSTPR